MKLKYIVFITSILVAIAAVFGIMQRFTYTNITGEAGFKDNLRVAQLGEALVDTSIERMKEELSDSPYILKVKFTGVTEYLYRVSQHKVQVVEVYKGSELQAGDEIYITNGQGHYVPEMKSIELSFVNEMEKDKEYLVFLENKIDTLASQTDNVYMMPDFIITTIFAYQDRECVVSTTHYDDSTYVDYKDVKNNEFFIDTEESMKKIIDFKHSLLEQYP